MTRARYDTDGLEPSQEIQDAVDKLAELLEADGWTVETTTELDGPEYRVGCAGIGDIVIPYGWAWFEGKTDEQLKAEVETYREKHGNPETIGLKFEHQPAFGMTMGELKRSIEQRYDFDDVSPLSEAEVRRIGGLIEDIAAERIGEGLTVSFGQVVVDERKKADRPREIDD